MTWREKLGLHDEVSFGEALFIIFVFTLLIPALLAVRAAEAWEDRND